MILDAPYGKRLMQAGSRADRGAKPAFRTRRLIAGDGDQRVGLAILSLCEARGWPVVAFADPEHRWPGNWRQTLFWDKGEAVGVGGDRDTCWKFTVELIQVSRRVECVRGRRDGAVLSRWPVRGQDYRDHPAAKPVGLMRYLIAKLTDPGDLVLDPCMGSGPVGVACLQTGRRFVGVEVDAGYYAVARDRVAAAEGEGTLFARTGSLFEPASAG